MAQLISDIENAQIDALKAGATAEEASLHGKLNMIEEVPTQRIGDGEADIPFVDEGTVIPVSSTEEEAPVEELDPMSQLAEDDSVDIMEQLLGIPSSTSEAYLRKRARDLTVLKKSIDPLLETDTANAISMAELSNAEDMQTVFDMYQQKFAEKKLRMGVATFEETLKNSDLPIDDAATQSLRDSAAEVYAQFSKGALGEEEAFVESVAPISLDQASKDTIIADNFAINLFNDYAEEKGVWESIADISGLIFNPEFPWAVEELVGEGFLGSREGLKQMVSDYQNLPPADKPAVFAELFPRIVEAFDDNPYKVLGAVALFNSEYSSDEVDKLYAIDTVSVLLYLFDIYALASLGTRLTQKYAFAYNMRAGAEQVVRNNRSGTSRGTTGGPRPFDPNNPGGGAPNTAGGRQGDTFEGAFAREDIQPTEIGVAGDQLDVAMTYSPYDMEMMPGGAGSTDGMSGAIDGVYKDITDTATNPVGTPVSDLKAKSLVIEIPAFTPLEREIAISKTWDQVYYAASQDGYTVDRATSVLSEDTHKFTFEYDLLNDTGLVVEKVKKTVSWTLNDVGQYTAVVDNYDISKLRNVMTNMWVDPESFMRHLDHTLVPGITAAQMQTAVARDALLARVKEINKGVSKAEQRRVNELLVAGDESGRIYSRNELETPTINLGSGMDSFSPVEIDNYMNKRQLNDDLWSLHNDEQRKTLEMLDAVQLHIDGADPQFVLPKAATANIQIELEKLVKAPGLSESGYMTGLQIKNRIKTLRADGYIIGELVSKFSVKGTKVNYVIWKESGEGGITNTTNLPHNVLNYEVGQVPRIYEDGLVFVKSSSGETMAVGHSMGEAEAFVLALNNNREATVAAINADTRLSPEDKATRLELANQVPHIIRSGDLEGLERLVEVANFSGGLVSGNRKRTPLINERGMPVGPREGSLTDMQGNKLEREDWNSAIQRSIDIVSRIMPINKYRMATIHRFSQTVEGISKRLASDAMFPQRGESWITSKIPITDPEVRAYFEAARNYLRSQLAIPTLEESRLNMWLARTADAFYDADVLGSKTGRRVALSLKSFDFVSAMRAANFQLQLGTLNPRQLYVQAVNASLAMSMNPTLAPMALTRTGPMRVLLYMNPEMRAKAVGKLTDGLGISSKDMLENIAQFERSGLMASIHQNPDNQVVAEGLTNGTLEAYRKAVKAGTFFFEAGESISRLVSWNIARTKWKNAHPNQPINDAAILEIHADTLRMMINMQSANASRYQTNPMTMLPTQYLQVTTKFIRNMYQGAKPGGGTGQDGWSRKESGKILAGMITMWGIGGIPFLEGAYEDLLRASGTTPLQFREDNPNIDEFIIDGAVGLMFNVAGFENTFGNTTANLLAGMTNNVIYNTIMNFWHVASGSSEVTIEDTFAELAFGPSKTTIDRSRNAMETFINNVKALTDVPSLDLLGNAVFDFTNDFLAITSTWSNARRVVFLERYKGYNSGSGKKLLSVGKFNALSWQTQLAAAWGIEPEVITAKYRLDESIKARQRAMTDTRNSIKKAIYVFATSGNIERYQSTTASLLGEWKSQDLRDKLLREALDAVAKEQATSGVDDTINKALMLFLSTGTPVEGNLSRLIIKDKNNGE